MLANRQNFYYSFSPHHATDFKYKYFAGEAANRPTLHLLHYVQFRKESWNSEDLMISKCFNIMKWNGCW